MKSIRVIIGAPNEGSTEFAYARGLADALIELECDASILLTGSSEKAEAESASSSSGGRVHRVPARLSDGLAEYWLEHIRFLEERAPCLYLCGPSGVADWAYQRLSSRILVVPVLHHDDETSYQYARLHGGSFDAVVPLHPSLRQRLLADLSELAPRVVTLPANPNSDERLGDDETVADFEPTARACLRIATELEGARSVPYARKRARMIMPAALPSELGDRETVKSAVQFMNWKPRWPDPVAITSSAELGNAQRDRAPSSLSDIRIVVGLTSGRISGVDIFSINLVRELRRLGLRAEVLQTMAGRTTSDSLPVPAEVPVVELPVPEYPTWPQRWASLKAYLEREPTIYLPNYDDRHAAIIPTLAEHVRAVGIAHSDDPQHYQHIPRLAPFWDGIIAVSSRIATELIALSGQLESRLSVIPYGLRVPPDFSGASRNVGDSLHAVYTGRLVQYQKRVFDLIRIVQEADDRNLSVDFVIAGTGPDGDMFFKRAAQALSHRIARVGGIPNDVLLAMLATRHVFVLPSSFEGLPVSLLEAMASGCVPVVAAMRSAIPDLIDDGRNGFLFDVGDTAVATRALARLAGDEDLRMTMARAAYETVQSRFTIQQVTQQYVTLFERILAVPYRRPIGPLSPPLSMHTFDANMPPFPLSLRKLIYATREMVN